MQVFSFNRETLHKLYKKTLIELCQRLSKMLWSIYDYRKGVYKEDAGAEFCADAPSDPLGQCLLSTTSPETLY